MIREGVLISYEGSEREFTVPGIVTRIGDLAFSGADGLERIEIPCNVMEIGNYTFMNCYSLREIVLPEKMTCIGAGLFRNCWQLKKIVLPEGTCAIGSDMFENCHELADLSIPRSLETAARTSLSGCRKLRYIRIDPEQLGILPPSARYTAALTFMEEHAADTDDPAVNAGIIDEYVKEKQRSFLDLAVNRRSEDAVRYMLRRGLVSQESLREYLKRSVDAGRVEITALLMDRLGELMNEEGRTQAMIGEDPFE